MHNAGQVCISPTRLLVQEKVYDACLDKFTAAVKEASGIAVQAVGMIADPHQAEAIVAEGRADCVALARAFLDDPRWAWHAADALGAAIVCPTQYRRARPDQWPGAALAHPHRRYRTPV